MKQFIVPQPIARGVMKVRKASPEILLVLGLAGMATAGVMAVKRKKALDEILDETDEKLEKSRKVAEDPEAVEYTDKERRQHIFYMKAECGWKIFKLYAPVVGVAVLSTGMIIGSHVILKKRNIALAGALKISDSALKKYRERIKEHVGEEAEKDLFRGFKRSTKTRVSDEGDTIEEEVYEKSDVDFSPYTKFFDSASDEFVKGDPAYNIAFLRAQEEHFTRVLNVRGHVIWNEVLDALDIPGDFPLGHMAGWVKGLGNDKVDFGIFIPENGNGRAINGYEDVVFLEFNLDTTNVLEHL